MSGNADELRRKLGKLFEVDTSCSTTSGIRISLKRSGADAAPSHLPPLASGSELLNSSNAAAMQAPVPVAVPSPAPGYGLRVENGRIIRESRHGDSEYAEWASRPGPALADLEKKPPAHRVKDRGPAILLADLEYAIVDVETTGGALMYGHRITEIAIVRVDARGRVLHDYSTLVNPGRTIPPAITALTHIDNGMVRMAPRFEDIAGDVRALLDGRIFVAHNAAFDWGFVSGELLRTTRKPLGAKKLCTVRLARKVVPEIRRRSLDSLQYFFNVENEARHRAFGDARATAIIFRKMMERVRDREIETWQQLENMTLRRSQKRRKRTAMPSPMEDV